MHVHARAYTHAPRQRMHSCGAVRAHLRQKGLMVRAALGGHSLFAGSLDLQGKAAGRERPAAVIITGARERLRTQRTAGLEKAANMQSTAGSR